MRKEENVAVKVSKVTIVGNVLLSLIKLIAGIVSNSGAMISDGVHSLSDVISTFIVIIGVKAGCKEADSKHPYGHERMECKAAIILSFILMFVGLMIGKSGLEKIYGNTEAIVIPGVLSLIVAVISIISKEAMFWYTKINAKKINSNALMADAWHHRSDALSSIGAFFGILGARCGFPILDPIASVIICVFIMAAAIKIFNDTMSSLVDEAVDEEIIDTIKEMILEQEGVIKIDLLNTRKFGAKFFVDVEILADGKLTLIESHEIAQNVHDVIERNLPDVKHVMVHVNPYHNP